MAQAIPNKSSNRDNLYQAIRGSARIAGELLALSSLGAGLISSILLVASVMP